MDLNLSVLCGRLATEPEIQVFDSGARILRLLVVVTTDEPRRRIDVIPVSMFDPPDDLIGSLKADERVWVTGSTQRRTYVRAEEQTFNGRRSRIEIVADQITTVHKKEEL